MKSSIGRWVALIAIAALAAAVSGCSESAQPVASGKGDIRGINAVVTAPEMEFLIEERSIGTVDFKGATGFDTYDNLSYNFNFDMFLPSEPDAVRVKTKSLKVDTDHQYTVVLTGTIDAPKTVVWDDPRREFDDGDTVFEAFFAHLAPSIGNVDVYFATPGIEPVDGTPVGTLSSGQRLPAMDIESGEYRLYVTRRDRPEEILFQSRKLATVARTRVTVAIFDPDPTVTTSLAVHVINDTGTSTPIVERNTAGQLRFLHAAVDIDGVDVFFEENLNDIVFGNAVRANATGYAGLDTQSTVVTITPTGNSGVTIIENGIVVNPTTRRTLHLAGTLAAPVLYVSPDSARPLETFPQFRVINLSANFDFLNVHLVESGTVIDEDLFPAFPGLPSLQDTGFFGTLTGRQELVITEFGETEALAPPLEFNLKNGNVVDVVILDTADPNVLELIVLDP